MTPDELVAQTRMLIETLRTADLDEAVEAGVDLAELGRELAATTAALEPHIVHDEIRMQAALRISGRFDAAMGELPDLAGLTSHEIFPYSPMTGRLNPISSPFRFWLDGDRVLGSGAFAAQHNGPPGGAHGGFVAAVLDELLGTTGALTGNHGFTGTLTIRYERLTPLDTELDLVGWVERTEGRKTFMVGEVRHDGVVTARADGVFIRPADSPFKS